MIFLIGFLWFYIAGLERCEDSLSLVRSTSVSQRNPIIIWSWEEGNFTFNGYNRINFPSNMLHSSSWMVVSLSFASSETLGRRQTMMLLKHVWVLPCFCSRITLTAHIQSVLFYNPHMFFWSTAQTVIFHSHKDHSSPVHKVFNSVQLAWLWEFNFWNVHLPFIKLYLADCRPSLQFKRSCWNHCCQSSCNLAPPIE